MKKIALTLSALLCVLFLILTLALGYVYFTVYSPERFTSGVSSSIDDAELETLIHGQIDLYSDTYGFDSDIIKSNINIDELHKLTAKYFTDYYSAFVNGEPTFPEFTYSDDTLYTVVSENTDKALRPELYVSEESKQLLAERYSNGISSVISSLSINTLYNTALGIREEYLSFASLGKYFIPCASVLVLLILITAILTVRTKHRKTAYCITLASFAATSLFAVPMTYISHLDLPSKLNVSVGSSSIYINAIYSFLITKASYVYIFAAAAAFALFITAVIWNVINSKSNN